MRKYVFKSCLTENIKGFIALKRSLGYTTRTKTHFLRTIDRAAVEMRHNSISITKEFADSFSRIGENESLATRYRRMVTLHQFATYLNDIGIDSYVPEVPLKHAKPYTPYIYTHKEIESIFSVVDNLKMHVAHRRRSPIFVFPFVFRLLYATGLRIGEALNLKVTDVDLVQKNLTITVSKNGKERVIPIRDSLNNVLIEYQEHRKNLCKGWNKSPYFFIRLDGINVPPSTLRKHFPAILIAAGLEFKGKSLSPRIHDFRHTFAVHALDQMIKSKVSRFDNLAILAAYLGHTHVASTERYVRLTQLSHLSMLHYPLDSSDNIFPNLDDYEEEFN